MPPKHHGHHGHHHHRSGGARQGSSEHSKQRDQLPSQPETKNFELIATQEEREHTSKSMYFDYKCRVATHPTFLCDNQRIQRFISLFDVATRGKSVLFIGAGMGFGVLPMLCAKYGARRVVGVDDSAVISTCNVLAKENNFDPETLLFLQGRISEGLDLPEKRFDYIFCDWVSNFITNDTPMLEDLLAARDKYLSPGGEVLPRSASMYAVGVSDYNYHQTSVEWWESVYGFKMSTMRECVIQEPTLGRVPMSTVVTEPVHVTSIDIMTLTLADAAYSATFSIKAARATTTLHFITTYVVVQYITANGVGFTAKCGPQDPESLVSQTSLVLPTFVPMNGGESLHVQWEMKNVKGAIPPRVEVKLQGKCDSVVAPTAFEKVYSYADYR